MKRHPFCTDRLDNKLIRSGVMRRRGGAKRSRTADLLSAIQALYQLSYSPWNWRTFTILDALGSLCRANVYPMCGTQSNVPKLPALPPYGHDTKASTKTACVNDSLSAISGTHHNLTPHPTNSHDNENLHRHLGIGANS